MAAPLPTTPLRFGPAGRYELQPQERRLLVDGESAALGARAFDLLLALAAQPGALLTKHQLMDQVWPGVVVQENNLAAQISALRKVLGGEVIATIPGRGYRFTARTDSAPALKAEQAAASGVSAPAAPPPGAPTLHTNLPQPLPALLGRSDDLAALGALIDRQPLVSIVGAGGIGKSLLAQHLLDGRRVAYKHGVCWVDLAPVSDPAELPGAVAAAIGVQTGSGEALAGLCGAVAPLAMLVALDNAEHLLDGVATMVLSLMSAAPQVRVVVTSQAPLKLAAEHVYRLGALAVPPGPLPAEQALAFGAVALFTERARAADARFALTDANAPAVIELCRALDGLALAIELAAARAPMLGVQRLASSMQDRLKLLTSSRNRAAPARQQTLRAALEWSHGFLDERERAVFRRLAVFAGSGSLALIQQVVADPAGEGELDEWAVLDALGVLVERSLVAVLASDDAAEPRYRLLDSPRALALERLKDAGEEAALRKRHTLAMAALCDAAWHAYFSGEIGEQAWHRAFALDVDNAREALAQACASGERVAALQIGATRLRALDDLPVAQRLEVIDQCEALLDESVPPALQVRVWLEISSSLTRTQGRRCHGAAQRALAVLTQSKELAGERFLHYLTWCHMPLAAVRVGDHAAAVAAVAEARAIEDSRWPPPRLYFRAEGEFWAAMEGSATRLGVTRQLLALDLAAGGSGHQVRANLIDAELAAGDPQAAARTGEALLTELDGSRKERSLLYARVNLMAARLALDDTTRARRLAEAGWPQAPLFGLQTWWADYLALLAALEGRPQAAARLAGYADAAYAACEIARQTNESVAVNRARALARTTLGDATFERLQAEGAALRYEQIAAIAFATGDGD